MIRVPKCVKWLRGHIYSGESHLERFSRLKRYQPSESRLQGTGSSPATDASGPRNPRRENESATSESHPRHPRSRVRSVHATPRRRIAKKLVEPRRRSAAAAILADFARQLPIGDWYTIQQASGDLQFPADADQSTTGAGRRRFPFSTLRDATSERVRPQRRDSDQRHPLKTLYTLSPSTTCATTVLTSKVPSIASAYCKRGTIAIGSAHFRLPNRSASVTNAFLTPENPQTKMRKNSHYLQGEA